MLDLPLSALGGIDRPRTMKFSGHVANADVVVMVDSGASHNFISSHLTGMFEHPLEFTPKFSVRLGDGHRAESEGKFSQLPINLGPITVPVDCFVFPLGSVDVILGVAWLKKLGHVKANRARMTMDFKLRYTQFFMSQLHRVTGKHLAIAKLPEDMSGGEQGYTPPDILATRMHSMNTQVLVQWEGQAKDDATWIDLADFRGQFPDSNLVGKVVPLAGSIDKDKDCNK
nr:uncharacterized protein LOC109182641 [Ipomoea trifida]